MDTSMDRATFYGKAANQFAKELKKTGKVSLLLPRSDFRPHQRSLAHRVRETLCITLSNRSFVVGTHFYESDLALSDSTLVSVAGDKL